MRLAPRNTWLALLTLASTLAHAAPPVPQLTAVTDDVLPVVGAIADGQSTNDNKPSLKGTAQSGNTVSVFDNGLPIGISVADTTGSWSFTPSILLDGLHSFTFSAADSTGTSAITSPFTIVVDTAPPIAPLAPQQAAGPTTAQPQLSGTAEPGSTVTVTSGSTLLGTAAADASTGAWTFTPGAPLAAGQHSITVWATDAAGNTSPASATLTLTVTLPPAPPTLALEAASDSGTPGDGITNIPQPWLTGTAPVGSQVQILNGTTVIGATRPNSSGAWRLQPTSPLADGTYTLSAQALTVPATPQILVVIDDVPPVIGAIYAGASTNDSTPTLQGTAEANSTIRVLDHGVLVGTTTANGLGIWVFTPSYGLVNGPHSFTITATDAAGATSDPSPAFVIVVDTVAPPAPSNVSVKNSATGDTIPNGGTTANTTPTFSGTAEADRTVTLYLNGSLIASMAVDALGHWSFRHPDPFPDDTYALTTTAIDAAGNVSLPSTPFSFTISAGSSNNSAPLPATPLPQAAPQAQVQPKTVLATSTTLSLTIDTTPPQPPAAPQQAAGPTASQPQFSGTAEPGSTVTVMSGSTQLGTAAADATTGTWAFTPAVPLVVGSHSITVIATDAAGNVSAASTALALTVTAPPEEVPPEEVPPEEPTGELSTAAHAVPSLTGPGWLLLSALAGLLGWRKRRQAA